jgi:hypothetical protein
METTTSTLKDWCSDAPVVGRNARARNLAVPLHFAIEANHKLGFAYSLNAEFAGRGAMRLGVQYCRATDPSCRASREESCCLNVGCTQIPRRAKACKGVVRIFSDSGAANCRGPYLVSLKRLALGSCDVRVVGDR